MWRCSQRCYCGGNHRQMHRQRRGRTPCAVTSKPVELTKLRTTVTFEMAFGAALVIVSLASNPFPTSMTSCERQLACYRAWLRVTRSRPSCVSTRRSSIASEACRASRSGKPAKCSVNIEQRARRLISRLLSLTMLRRGLQGTLFLTAIQTRRRGSPGQFG